MRTCICAGCKHAGSGRLRASPWSHHKCGKHPRLPEELVHVLAAPAAGLVLLPVAEQAVRHHRLRVQAAKVGLLPSTPDSHKIARKTCYGTRLLR